MFSDEASPAGAWMESAIGTEHGPWMLRALLRGRSHDGNRSRAVKRWVA